MTVSGLADLSVLITGGAGFVGSHLATALVDTADVTVLDDLSTGRRANVPAGATFLEGDVRDADTLDDAMAGVDVVFHEAAAVTVQGSIDDPPGTHDVTVDGTLAVLEAARRADARVVTASSAAIYGHPETIPVPETHPTNPASPYGIDKLAVDHYTRRYHDLYGLETVALRYFNVYGPRHRGGDYSGVITIFRDQALAGDPLTVDGDGTQTRDFVHVADVVDANRLAATTEHVGEAYNVGTGTETTINDLATTITTITDSDAPIEHGDPRPGDITHSRADITRAREALGYEPTISLREGLRTIV